MRWAVERVSGGQRPATPLSPSQSEAIPAKGWAAATCTTQPSAHVTQHGPTALLVQERRSDALGEKIAVQGHTNVDPWAPTYTIFARLTEKVNQYGDHIHSSEDRQRARRA